LILYAIPTPLGGSATDALTPSALQTVKKLKDFAVENAKSARAFLKDAGLQPRDLSIVEITPEVQPLLAPLREGRNLGLLSEAGCPAIADPGAKLVEAAHREGFEVVPLVGPSSITLALMASGLEGQRFTFWGYLPRETADRERQIRELEKRSRIEKATQLFIETPYRNDALLGSLLKSCHEQTQLCVAADLTLASQFIRTKTIREWRAAVPPIGKRPAVFLLLAE
jgi:16S rRNA (cytidine1402-2'-O)-methyltransferase